MVAVRPLIVCRRNVGKNGHHGAAAGATAADAYRHSSGVVLDSM
jgi:hypothetical protein